MTTNGDSSIDFAILLTAVNYVNMNFREIRHPRHSVRSMGGYPDRA